MKHEILEKRYALNAAPILDSSASPQLDSVNEAAGVPFGEVGTLVSDLIDVDGRLDNYSDIDGDLPGIAITGTNLQGGTLWYSSNGGSTWQDIEAVADTVPTYLPADPVSRIYFQPPENFSGSIDDVITFRAWDLSYTWQQLGADIDGLMSGEQFGSTVSISADGTTVAAGAFFHAGNGLNSGRVTAYRLNGSEWLKLGNDIDGEAADDQLGYVSLAADGNTIAVGTTLHDGVGFNSGRVRVYRLTDSSWVQVGDAIDGKFAGDKSGHVSLSADGNTIIIGSPSNSSNGQDSGHARIYRFIDSTWMQVGSDLEGESAGDYAGESVAISADGKIVAIGARGNDAGGVDAGHVRIYRLVDSSWVQLGEDIDGVTGASASTVSLSADGYTVAIGAALDEPGGRIDSGGVTVYRFNNSSWKKWGQEFPFGEAWHDNFGEQVSLSADGRVVSVGASRNGNNTWEERGTNTGHVRVYRFNQSTNSPWNGSWDQVGADIDGENPEDYSGRAVAMSDNGQFVAIGAPENDGNGDNSGHVRIYRLQGNRSALTDTVAVDVIATNIPPALNSSASPRLNAIDEDAGIPVGLVGTLVSDLVDAGGDHNNYSDSEGDLLGIAITGVNLDGATLWFSTNNGSSWENAGDISPFSALLLYADSSTRVYVQPPVGVAGRFDSLLEFSAWDREGGFTNGQNDVDLGNITIIASQDHVWQGSSQDAVFTADGTVVFQTGASTGFGVADASDRNDHKWLKSIGIYDYGAYGIALSSDENTLLVAARGHTDNPGVMVYDVTDPLEPVEIALVPLWYVVDVVFVPNSPYALAVNDSTGLRVIDLSTPASPAIVGSISGPSGSVTVSMFSKRE